MAGEDVGLLFSVPRHWRLAHLCTACSVLAATSGLQGGWENASLCLQIFTRISVVFFAFVPAICLCFLRLFLCCFYFSVPASKRRASLSVFVWLVAYFQEHDTGKKCGFKAILLQVNSGNHLCKCSSVLCERSILTGGEDLWSEEVQTAHIQLFSLPSRGNQSICKRLLQYSHTCASALRQKWKIRILKSDNHKVPLLFFCCRTCSDLLLKNS